MGWDHFYNDPYIVYVMTACTKASAELSSTAAEAAADKSPPHHLARWVSSACSDSITRYARVLAEMNTAVAIAHELDIQ